MNFRKLLTYFAFGTAAVMPFAGAQNPTILQGNYITNVFGNSNFVLNPNAQTNVANVTVSSATVTRSTTTPLVATSEFNITTSTSTGYADWSLRVFDEGMKNNNCEARFTYRGFSVGSTTAQILQGANVVAQLTLTASTDPRIASINFPCGDLSAVTKFRLQQATASLTGTNEIGGIYVGLATNMANVAQAETVVLASATAANLQTISTASVTKVDYASKSLDVYNEYNTSTSTFTAKRAGTYQVSAGLLFNQNSWSANNEIEIYVRKNSTNICSNSRRIEAAVTSWQWNNVICNFQAVAGDTVDIAIYQNSGGNRDLYGSTTNSRFQISRFPSSSELVVKPETQNVWGGVQVVNSAGSASNTVSSAAWAKLTSSAALTRTAYGKAKVETNNDFSITIENMPVGSYLVTASGTLQANSSAAAGLTECIFGLADSATGGAQIGSTSVNATGDIGAPTQYIGGQSFSGVYVNTSVANRTFFLQAYRGSGTGGCYAYTNTQRPFNITVTPLDQPSNSALYVQGPVLGAQTGAAIPAGYAGYTIESTQTGTTTPTLSNTWYTTESVTLTPGVWMCFANSAFYYPGAGAPTAFNAWDFGICTGTNCTPTQNTGIHGSNIAATRNGGTDYGTTLNNSKIITVTSSTTYSLSSRFIFTARNSLVIDNNESYLRCTLLN